MLIHYFGTSQLLLIDSSDIDSNVASWQSPSIATDSVLQPQPPSVTGSSNYDRRQSGQVASDAQIIAACATNNIVVQNGGFEIADSTSGAIFWNVSSNSPNITFDSIDIDSLQQITPNGMHLGRVISLDASAVVRVSQPLTLCPNTIYNLSVWDRQPRSIAQCRARYLFGNTTIILAQAETSFRLRTASVQGGADAGAVSVDLNIEVKCIGSQDSRGRSVWEVDEVSITRA